MLFTIFMEVTEEGHLVRKRFELHGVISEGRTREELRKNIAEAIQLSSNTPISSGVNFAISFSLLFSYKQNLSLVYLYRAVYTRHI